MYAITLHQPWATLIALGLKNVETRSWPAPVSLLGQTFAIHAGKRLVRQPGECIEQELRARLGEEWNRAIPTGVVLATATLAGMARVEYVDPMTGHAVHDVGTEMGCAAGTGRTLIDPWGDFRPGRWLWFLDDVEALPEPVPAVSRQSFSPTATITPSSRIETATRWKRRPPSPAMPRWRTPSATRSMAWGSTILFSSTSTISVAPGIGRPPRSTRLISRRKA